MAAPGQSQAGIHTVRNLHESSSFVRCQSHEPTGTSHDMSRGKHGEGHDATTHNSNLDSTRGNTSGGLGTRACSRFQSKSNMHTCRSACNTRAAALSDRPIGNKWPGLQVGRHHHRRKWLKRCVWQIELAPSRAATASPPSSTLAQRTTKTIDGRVFDRYPAQRTTLVAEASAFVRDFQAL
jgi:hypothetical protein